MQSIQITALERFLENHGIKIAIREIGRACPLECSGQHAHGNQHIVQLTRQKQYKSDCRSLRFSLWSSLHSMQDGRSLTVWDAISSVLYMLMLYPKPLDEYCLELDCCPKNHICQKTWRLTQRLGGRFTKFFSQEELSAIRAIIFADAAVMAGSNGEHKCSLGEYMNT